MFYTHDNLMNATLASISSIPAWLSFIAGDPSVVATLLLPILLFAIGKGADLLFRYYMWTRHKDKSE